MNISKKNILIGVFIGLLILFGLLYYFLVYKQNNPIYQPRSINQDRESESASKIPNITSYSAKNVTNGTGTIPNNDTSMKNMTIITPKSVLIFVDELTYQHLTNELGRLADDIKSDISADVYIQHANHFDPVQIRNTIKDYYKNRGLLGSILIGDIPNIMIENAGGGFIGNVAFPSDAYYQDLDDDLWTDFNSNGFFDARIGLQPPAVINEVWSGRIKPTETGEEGIIQLRNYLDKNHAYRTSPPKPLKQLLYYNAVYEEDVVKGIESSTVEKWLDNSLKNIAIYTSNDPNNPFFNYSYVDYVNFINLSTPEDEKEDYLSKLSNTDYELVLTNIHGSPDSVYISSDDGGIYITTEEIRDLQPRGLFYVMASCSTGRFTEQHYYAGELLFNGRGLGVYAYTEPVALAGYQTLLAINFLMGYSPLRLGVTWGDIIKHDTTSVTIFLGDPTLRLRPQSKIIENLKWEVSGPLVQDMKVGEKVNIFRIKNLGPTPLFLSAISSYVSINGRILIPESFKNLYPDIAANPIYTIEESLVGLISPSEENIQSKGVFHPVPDGTILNGYRLLENEALEFTIDLTKPRVNIDTPREEEYVQFYHTNDPNHPFIELRAKIRINPSDVPIPIQPKGWERG